MEQRQLLSTVVVTNTGDNGGVNPAPGAGTGTLRQAIVDTNASSDNTDTINFNIPTTDANFANGVFTITPQSQLPVIESETTVDGTSQPGHGATPVIVIDGTTASAGNTSANGLHIDDLTGNVYGLKIKNFSNDGIVYSGTTGGMIGGLTAGAGNVIINCGKGSAGAGIELYDAGEVIIEGNDIGTDSAGTASEGNTIGILLDNRANGATIGGTAAGAGNVIAGNSAADISVSFSDYETIQGNLIGVDPTGTKSMNGQTGISILAGMNITIGGTTATARNVIGGEGNQGILLLGSDDQNGNYNFTQFDTVQGNFIGVGANGSTAIPNGVGIEIGKDTFSNTIGGSLASQANTIADNTSGGVGFDYHSTLNSFNSIRLNSIFANGGIGIDLNQDGVTPNDNGDSDSGPNDLQNYPLLASATVSGSTTTIQGSINSNPNTSLVLDLYSTATLGTSSTAQGQTYLGSVSVNTDSSGNATFKTKLSTAVPANQYITATATTTAGAPYGDTSEFSAPIQVVAAVTADTTAPTASLSSAPSVTTATTSPYNFSVTYSDNVAVKASTIDNYDLVVTGPNGYSQTATLTSTGLTDGPTVVANYSVPAPASGFSSSSNGAYTVTLQPNQVSDTSGNFAASGTLGNFTVTVPTPPAPTGNLAGSANTAASGYNLTTLGSNDWAKFGRNGVLGNFDHKATGSSQISNVTLVDSGSYGGYNDPARNTSWSDGSPTAVDSNDHGFIYANNKLGAGYSFTVPADATSRVLYIYLGGYSSGGTLTAHLSDGSSADYTATFSSTGKYNEIVEIDYKSASAGQKLTLTYVKTQTINNAGGSIDLMAAALTGAALADTVAPTATLTSSTNVNSATTSPYTFAVTYKDNVAVKASTVGHNDVLVTGPNGYSQLATLTSTGLQDGPSVVATYSVPAPSGGFASASNGQYTITMQPNQVSDTSANFVAGGTLGTFTVNVPAPAPVTGGTLTGSSVAAATSYNFTTLGTTDWAHFGRAGSYTGFDHKKTGNSQISNVTTIGPNPNVGGYNDPNRNVTWTDGSPTTSDTNDHGFIYNNGAFGSGFSFTVAAGTTAHTLYLYAGGFASGGTLTAHLSDGSAADYVATPSSSGKYNNLYTIQFAAASAGQTLTITHVRTQQFSNGGSIDLMGAALA